MNGLSVHDACLWGYREIGSLPYSVDKESPITQNDFLKKTFKALKGGVFTPHISVASL